MCSVLGVLPPQESRQAEQGSRHCRDWSLHGSSHSSSVPGCGAALSMLPCLCRIRGTPGMAGAHQAQWPSEVSWFQGMRA